MGSTVSTDSVQPNVNRKSDAPVSIGLDERVGKTAIYEQNHGDCISSSVAEIDSHFGLIVLVVPRAKLIHGRVRPLAQVS